MKVKKEKKPESKKNIIIIIGILTIVSISILSIFFIRNSENFKNSSSEKPKEIKEQKEQNDSKTESDKKENKEENGSEIKSEEQQKEEFDYKLKIYKSARGDFSLTKTEGYNEIALTIDVESENSKIYVHDATDAWTKEINYVLYKDKTLKLYNVNTKEKIDIDLDYDSYVLHKHEGKIIGIVYYNNKENSEETYNYGYYNLKTKKKLYENKYAILWPNSSNEFIVGLTSNEEGENGGIVTEKHLLHTDEEKIQFKSEEQEEMWSRIDILEYNNKYYYLLPYGDVGPEIYAVYSNSGKYIGGGTEGEEITFDDDGNFYITDSKKVDKYNIEGKLLATSKSYSKIIGLEEKYIIYVENKELILTDFNNSFSKKITSIPNIDSNDELYYITITKGEYDYDIDEIINKDKIYISISENANNIKIEYNTKTKEITIKEIDL